MTRPRIALALVLVLAAVALAYGLTRSPVPEQAAPSLQPLIARAALEPCFGEVASRAGAKGLIPDLQLPCLDGDGNRELLWTGTRTQTPTLVNVYGSWCAPCAVEMPHLRRLHDAAGSRLRVLGIDTEDDHRNGLLFAIDLKQRWPALRDDDGRVSRALGGGAPKMIYIDATGTVVQVKRGYYKTYAELQADVRRYLGLQL